MTLQRAREYVCVCVSSLDLSYVQWWCGDDNKMLWSGELNTNVSTYTHLTLAAATAITWKIMWMPHFPSIKTLQSIARQHHFCSSLFRYLGFIYEAKALSDFVTFTLSPKTYSIYIYRKSSWATNGRRHHYSAMPLRLISSLWPDCNFR